MTVTSQRERNADGGTASIAGQGSGPPASFECGSAEVALSSTADYCLAGVQYAAWNLVQETASACCRATTSTMQDALGSGCKMRR